MDNEKQPSRKFVVSQNTINGGGDVLGTIITPDNVTMIVSLLGAGAGVGATAIKGLQLWFDEKKSRKIRVQYEELEVEITGAHSIDELHAQLEVFRSLKEELNHKKVRIELID